MLKFEWKESKGKFSSGETLYIKDYPLGDGLGIVAVLKIVTRFLM
jgi:hypothetical protein